MEGYGKIPALLFRKTKVRVYVYIAQPTLINNSDKKYMLSFSKFFSSGTAQQGFILLVASRHPARLATGVKYVTSL